MMKRFDSGEALAKEMGISPTHLKKTFETTIPVPRQRKIHSAKRYSNFLALYAFAS